MELNDFLERNNKKLNYLEKKFITDIFFKEYGNTGLDIIQPQVEISRNDGSDKKYVIDFVVTTKKKRYAIETHGFHSHSPEGKFVDENRFDVLQSKNNLIREKFDKYIELTKNQIDSIDDAIFELRRYFKSDKELYDLYLNRKSNEIKPNQVQKKCLEKLKNKRNDGVKSGLVILATGLGKTFLSGFDIIQTKATKILFIAHVSEILRKTKNDFEDLIPERSSEMVMFNSSDETPTNFNIHFSTIQSIHQDKNLKKFPVNFFNYIVIDEAHHSAANTYLKVINYFKPNFLLGLTATPFRSDEKEIVPLFGGNIIFRMDQEQAINEGYLANIEYTGYFDDVDYSDIRWNGNRYDIDDLNKKLLIESRDNAILKKYNNITTDNNKTIGFCSSIEHADYMEKVFNNNGIKSISIHSKSESHLSKYNSSEKVSLISRFRKGEFQVAFTVNMFNEGVDIPDISTILMLRPTDSLTIFIQQIGRGLRLSDGKDKLTVLDFIGNYRNADIITKGLGLKLSDLSYDREKDIFYYDNNGKKVEFESKVVNIFKALISKRTKEVDINQINESIWKDYGNFLDKSTTTDSENKNSLNQYWQVDKKKKDLELHLKVIDFYLDNINSYSKISDFDYELKKYLTNNNFKIEGTRALFFSKLLGIITTNSPFDGTEVYYSIVSKENNDLNEIISNQMEKLYYWNDIYSPINRHAKNSRISNKESIFSIYPVFFIYQILHRLHLFGEKTYLSKFELEFFVFFSRNHDDVDEVFERILSFRKSSNIYELEKYLRKKVKKDKSLNKYNIYDSRYYSILKFVKHFKWNPKGGIFLKIDHLNEFILTVENFEKIIKEKNIFHNEDYIDYRQMLYSSKSLTEYYLK